MANLAVLAMLNVFAIVRTACREKSSRLTRPAYYNEIDPHGAAWLRVLIERGLIAVGDVDERSILDVTPDDIKPYGQAHFFAGIGGWSYALRLAGIPDDRPVWTGSCPCQPFSVAGAQRGCEDERHLWPAFFTLIRECRPVIVFGEQVAGGAGLAWYDHVHADLEGAGYAVAAANLPACGVGAWHKRQRLYWVAHAEMRGFGIHGRTQGQRGHPAQRNATGGVANADGRIDGPQREQCGRQQRLQPVGREVSLMDNPKRARLEGHGADQGPRGWNSAGRPTSTAGNAGPWTDPEWIECTDGKTRPTQSGIFPLADGLPKGLVRGGDRSMAPDANASQEGRVMRLRGYGNAIVPQLAAAFVRAAV